MDPITSALLGKVSSYVVDRVVARVSSATDDAVGGIRDLKRSFDDELLAPFREATYHLSQRDYEHARLGSVRAMSKVPESPVAHLLLATTARLCGREREAQAELREGLALDPTILPRSLIGPTYSRSGDIGYVHVYGNGKRGRPPVSWSRSIGDLGVSPDGRPRIKRPLSAKALTAAKATGTFVHYGLRQAAVFSLPDIAGVHLEQISLVSDLFAGTGVAVATMLRPKEMGADESRVTMAFDPATGGPKWARKLAKTEHVAYATARYVVFVHGDDSTGREFSLVDATTGNLLRKLGGSSFQQLFRPAWSETKELGTARLAPANTLLRSNWAVIRDPLGLLPQALVGGNEMFGVGGPVVWRARGWIGSCPAADVDRIAVETHERGLKPVTRAL